MNIKIVTEELCTGCGACLNVCPTSAIIMRYNEEGFLVPKIDNEKCINCGLCTNVCPALNQFYENKIPEVYAAWAKESIRKVSSSGGVFSVLANYVLEKGGYVCGAAFDENMNLNHIVINSKSELPKLLRSKYLQSNTNLCYKKVKDLLKNGKHVLFCSVPCQVAGLNNFLRGTDTKNLLTIDLLCHGGVAPLIFKKWLRECFPDKKVIDCNFRDKEAYGWSSSSSSSLLFNDGTKFQEGRGKRDLYYRAFLPCYSVRKSCGDCKFAKLPRQGDFTLGDFWGCEKYDTKLADKKGTSLIFVNNEKSERILKEVKHDLPCLLKVDLNYIITKTGQPLSHPYKKTSFMRERFFFYSKYNSFEKAVDYCEKGKFDVAIVGVWYGWNYGSVLTNFALYKYLRSLGLLTLMIEKPCQTKFSKDIELNPEFHSRKFAIKHYGYNISHPRMPEEMYELNDFADIFITGSDQLWHYNTEKNSRGAFLLNFVTDRTHKKISYATSFGHDIDYTPNEEKQRRKNLFKKFDSISVREKSGIKILESYGVKAETVIDPIFIADKGIYDELSVESGLDINQPFLTAYILDPTQEKIESVEIIAKKLNLEIKFILDGDPRNYNKYKDVVSKYLVQKPSIEDWVYYLKNAKFIITDSYHGTCFSILFEKKFITFGNEYRGLARFNTLFEIIGNKDRLFIDPLKASSSHLIFEEMDYSLINKELSKVINFSQQWLKNAIYSEKIVNDYSVFSIKNKNDKR